MTKNMDVEDRRKMHRRSSDVCPFHDLCFDQQQQKWDDHNKEHENHKKEHETMWRAIGGSLQWKVFVLILAASIGILGAGFTYFGHAQSKQGEQITTILMNQAVVVDNLKELIDQHKK